MAFPTLMAVVNVTPDSFSDGGLHASAQDAIVYAQCLLDQGAGILDIGAESTRPGAQVVSAQEEWARLESVLPEMIRRSHAGGALVSIDTYHAQTAVKALEAGADIINDVTGFSDPAMIAAVKDSECRCVVMHALDVPVVAEHALPEDTDIITFMRDWCAQVVARMEAAGIARERLIVDPGPGFGKTAKQSWQLVSDLAGWRPEGVPVLIGHSRKRFLNLFDAQADAASRDALTRSVSAMLAAQGADIIRVHDVEGHRALFEALR